MYTQLLKKFDNVIAPPYPVMQKKNMQQYDNVKFFQDYYKIQMNIWKCIWMRFGNRLITGGVRKPVTPADEDYDTVD